HYSAHADQGELLDWIVQRGPISGGLFLDHGEPDALEALRRELQRLEPELQVRLPRVGESYRLAAGQAAKRIATGNLEAQQVIGRDWQNAYADLATRLKSDLARIRDEKKREEAIARMREVLDSYSEFRNSRHTRSRD